VASSNMYYGPPCTQPLHHGRRHWSKRRWIICWGVVGVANAVEGKRGAITSMSWGRLAKGRYQQRDDAATASRKKKKRKGKKKSMGSRRVHAEDWVKVDSPLGGDAKENKDAAASAVDVTAVLKSKTAQSTGKLQRHGGEGGRGGGEEKQQQQGTLRGGAASSECSKLGVACVNGYQ